MLSLSKWVGECLHRQHSCPVATFTHTQTLSLGERGDRHLRPAQPRRRRQCRQSSRDNHNPGSSQCPLDSKYFADGPQAQVAYPAKSDREHPGTDRPSSHFVGDVQRSMTRRAPEPSLWSNPDRPVGLCSFDSHIIFTHVAVNPGQSANLTGPRVRNEFDQLNISVRVHQCEHHGT